MRRLLLNPQIIVAAIIAVCAWAVVLSKRLRKNPALLIVLTMLAGLEAAVRFWIDWATSGLMDSGTLTSGVAFGSMVLLALVLWSEVKRRNRPKGG